MLKVIKDKWWENLLKKREQNLFIYLLTLPSFPKVIFFVKSLIYFDKSGSKPL